MAQHPQDMIGLKPCAAVRYDIAFIQHPGDPMCAVSFPCYLKKYFPDNFALARVYLQILYRAAFFVHSALIDRTVAERDRTAHVVSILYNLFHPSFDADGSFLRFTGRLPESDVVEQIVHITVKPLLTLHRAPHRYPLFYKPFQYKRRFVILSAQTVEHEDQQDIKLLFFRFPLDFLQFVSICRGDLKS